MGDQTEMESKDVGAFEDPLTDAADVESSTDVKEAAPSTDERSESPKSSKRKVGFLSSATRTVKIVISLVIVVVVIVAGLSVYQMLTSTGTTTVSKASLTKAVSISKLSTAEFTYNGIAEKLRSSDSEDVEYHVYYEARATAGIDMEKIDFQINEANHTVTPILPEVTVGEPVVDESKLAYLPEGVDVNMREVLMLCKEDAQREMESNSQIRETAYENLRSTVEALLIPLLKGNGYTINWADSNIAADEKGDGNEAA